MSDSNPAAERTGQSRTYEWTDPATVAAAAASMSGLDFLSAWRDGVVHGPPMADTLGRMRVVEVRAGRVVFTLQPQEYHYNPVGFVHGGLACTLLDSAMACAVHSTLDQGVGYTSLDITVRFVRGITATTGTLQAIGEVENVGRKVSTATGRLLSSSGKLLASGSTTCLILPAPHVAPVDPYPGQAEARPA